MHLYLKANWTAQVSARRAKEWGLRILGRHDQFEVMPHLLGQRLKSGGELAKTHDSTIQCDFFG
jgi:hypothetical protein